jgi:hypothetical protein
MCGEPSSVCGKASVLGKVGVVQLGKLTGVDACAFGHCLGGPLRPIQCGRACRRPMAGFFLILSGGNPTKLLSITGVQDDPKRYRITKGSRN